MTWLNCKCTFFSFFNTPVYSCCKINYTTLKRSHLHYLGYGILSINDEYILYACVCVCVCGHACLHPSILYKFTHGKTKRMSWLGIVSQQLNLKLSALCMYEFGNHHFKVSLSLFYCIFAVVVDLQLVRVSTFDNVFKPKLFTLFCIFCWFQMPQLPMMQIRTV